MKSWRRLARERCPPRPPRTPSARPRREPRPPRSGPGRSLETGPSLPRASAWAATSVPVRWRIPPSGLQVPLKRGSSVTPCSACPPCANMAAAGQPPPVKVRVEGNGRMVHWSELGGFDPYTHRHKPYPGTRNVPAWDFAPQRSLAEVAAIAAGGAAVGRARGVRGEQAAGSRQRAGGGGCTGGRPQAAARTGQ